MDYSITPRCLGSRIHRGFSADNGQLSLASRLAAEPFFFQFPAFSFAILQQPPSSREREYEHEYEHEHAPHPLPRPTRISALFHLFQAPTRLLLTSEPESGMWMPALDAWMMPGLAILPL
jgi:hypothetical protein